MLIASFLLSTAFASDNCSINMSVDGMSCAGGCPVKVTNALKAVDGVTKVTPYFDKKAADIEANGATCKETGHDKLIAALKEVGYTSKVVSVDKNNKDM
jgi:copper chaperone CopZ